MRTDCFAVSPLTRPLLAGVLGMAALLWGSTAGAQVVRCIDPATGHLTYTDGKCPRGQGATEIEPPHSEAEIASHEERARAARERWQAEQLRLQKLAPPAPAPLSPSAQRANACQSAQEQLHALSRNGADPATLDAAQRSMEMQCLGPEAYAALERSRANALAPGETTVVLPHHLRPLPPRPSPPQEPVQRLNCNVFRCFDQRGNAMPAPSPGQIR